MSHATRGPANDVSGNRRQGEFAQPAAPRFRDAAHETRRPGQ